MWPDAFRERFVQAFGSDDMAQIWAQCIDGLRALYRERKGDMCSHLLPFIRCPTLVLCGTSDPLVPVEMQSRLREKIANAELYKIVGGRHDMHLHKADEFNRVVAEFLQRKV